MEQTINNFVAIDKLVVFDVDLVNYMSTFSQDYGSANYFIKI